MASAEGTQYIQQQIAGENTLYNNLYPSPKRYVLWGVEIHRRNYKAQKVQPSRKIDGAWYTYFNHKIGKKFYVH
jgi:hypothetical protein